MSHAGQGRAAPQPAPPLLSNLEVGAAVARAVFGELFQQLSGWGRLPLPGVDGEDLAQPGEETQYNEAETKSKSCGGLRFIAD